MIRKSIDAFMKCYLLIMAVYLYSNTPNPNQKFILLVSITGILWVISSYIEIYQEEFMKDRIDKLEKSVGIK